MVKELEKPQSFKVAPNKYLIEHYHKTELCNSSFIESMILLAILSCLL